VPLYWHVITNSSGDGALSDAEIASQVDVINQDFAPHFAFVLKNISRTVNDSWFNVEFDSPEEDAMAKSLHVGGRQDLNVNSCTPVDALAWVGKFPSSKCRSPQLHVAGAAPARLCGAFCVAHWGSACVP